MRSIFQKTYYSLLVLIIVFVLGCKESQNNAKYVTGNDSKLTNNSPSVKEWSDAVSEKNINKLSSIYGDSIIYYGKKIDKQSCLNNKEQFFNKYPDFSQLVKNIQTVDSNSNFERKLSFTKTVTINQESKEFSSYLIYNKIGGEWLITTEGDLTTDKNVEDKRSAGKQSVRNTNDKWFVMSETEVQYLNENGDKITNLVQLRTLNSNLKSYIEEGGGCFSNEPNKVYTSSQWEIVINPDQSNEDLIPIDDFGGFVQNTNHDGSLYNQSFINDNEKLFFYYLGYGSCSNEVLFLFYYNKSTGKISKSKFQFESGQVQEDVDILNSFPFGNNKLKKVSLKDCDNNKNDCPIGSFKNFSFANGIGYWFIQLWKFDNTNNKFYLYSVKEIDDEKFIYDSLY